MSVRWGSHSVLLDSTITKEDIDDIPFLTHPGGHRRGSGGLRPDRRHGARAAGAADGAWRSARPSDVPLRRAALFLVLHAIGVQKYTCQANGTWLFTDPEANLYKSPAPEAGRHALPELRHRAPRVAVQDGSSVEAARTVTRSRPAPGNIASLLLQAVTTTGGADGDRLTRRRGCSG